MENVLAQLLTALMQMTDVDSAIEAAETHLQEMGWRKDSLTGTEWLYEGD